VAQLLREQNYSLQSNRKTEEGADHPDRDAQFRHINAQVKRALAKGMPVISVDTKKKELLGNYDNSGQQSCLAALGQTRNATAKRPGALPVGHDRARFGQ
jgi:hypothetical protein